MEVNSSVNELVYLDFLLYLLFIQIQPKQSCFFGRKATVLSDKYRRPVKA